MAREDERPHEARQADGVSEVRGQSASLSATYNFLAWCEANGARGAKLLGEYVDPFWPPTAFTKGSKRKARWKCETCAHAWNAMVFSRTRDKNPTGCPACNPALGKRNRDDA